MEVVEETQINDFLRSAGEVLRLLASVLQPLRASGNMPAIGSAIHRRVLTRLCDCFQITLAGLTRPDQNDTIHFYRLFERIMLLLRLVQFQVAFQIDNSANAMDLMAALVSLLAVSLAIRGTVMKEKLIFFSHSGSVLPVEAGSGLRNRGCHSRYLIPYIVW